MKPHKWAAEIHAFADGQVIQGRTHHKGSEWIDISSPDWGSDRWEYRVKPTEPERIYPKTQMTGDDLLRIRDIDAQGCGPKSYLPIIVNAALRHACDNGQIVTREEFDRAVGDRKARDLAVAKAVRDSFMWIRVAITVDRFDDEYLQKVIKGVTNV